MKNIITPQDIIMDIILLLITLITDIPGVEVEETIIEVEAEVEVEVGAGA